MSTTALVVGGTSGIGLATARLLAKQFNRVVVASRTGSPPPPLEHIALDATLSAEPLTAFTHVNAFVYCPGSILLKPFHRTTDDDFKQQFELNVLGAVRCLQAVLPALKAANGSAVLVSSVAAAVGLPFHSAVAASKAAVEALVRSLAAEWAPAVRVNAVSPTLTNTPLAATLLNNDQKRDAAAARNPLKRVGDAEEVAAAICFLVSPQASMVTGQVLAVDGGFAGLRL